MWIHEAVKRAMKNNSYITLPEFSGVTKIKPGSSGNCILMNADGSHPSKHGWQPSAEDLIRSDWIVTD